MNHWIGGICDNSPEKNAHTAIPNYSDETSEMVGVYKSLGLHLLHTVADGDCGIDVCNMILGWERTQANRQIVRNRLCECAYNGRANRAFIWLMHVSGEITRHDGVQNLSDSFEDLLQTHDNPAAFAGHHGDGVGIVAVKHNDSGLLNHHGSGVPAVPQPGDCPAREVTDEEFEAFKWKCSLHKMPAPIIK